MTRTPELVVAQPPAAWRVLPPLVVDCSVLAAFLFDEPARDAAAARLSGMALHVPWLIDFEFASVALRKTREGLSEVVSVALADYEALSLARHRVPPSLQRALAAEHGLSTYDAAYLALAAELRAPLATFDRRLGEAAMRHLGRL